MKILIQDKFDKSLPGRLARFGEVFEDPKRVAEAEVVLVRSATKCTKEYIDGAPKLKLIIRGGVGIDNIDSAHAKSKGILVMNTPEASSVAVAELAMAFLVAIPAKLIPGHVAMTQKKFLKKELKRTELYQKTLGILGMGRIGTETAKRAKAFGMEVIGCDPLVPKSEHAKMVSLDELLAKSDLISMNLPLNDSTRGMINAAALGKVKKGVIIVNTGRGKTVDEAALAAALADGVVGAYGTDVWMSDPPDFENCPLLKAPNVYMTPHIGASSNENLLRIGDCVVSIIDKLAKEGKL
jgi:D-3-phosphoglycerate dehydrogenase